MKILMVSDTHGNISRYKELLHRVGKVDAIFHMGDSQRSLIELEELSDIPLYVVAGNCDFGYQLPREHVVDLGGHRFFLTHGHRYGVKYGLSELKDAAWDRKADVVCFGHTHETVIDDEDGITAVNPGSLCQPRPYSAKPSYILLEIDDANELHFAVNYF